MLVQLSANTAIAGITVIGISTDDEIKEYLALDAQILELAQPVAPSRVFDFAIQRDGNKEVGIK